MNDDQTKLNIPAPAEQNPPINAKPERRFGKKQLVILAATALAIAGGALAISRFRVNPAPEPKIQAKTAGQTVANSPSSIRIIATGDFIAHDSLNQQAKQANGSYDYLQFMADFKPVFAKADISFCNQATISAGEAFGISGYPVFNAPAKFAKDMAGLGCNLINTASNHSFDKGQAAIDATLKVWAGIPGLLAVAGENSSQQQKDNIHYFDMKGMKFAFLAYTTYSNTTPPNSYGVNMFSRELAQAQIQSAKAAGAQFIITSMRWGTEYSSQINAEQAADSQFLSDQGVGLIIGHGPHQLQTAKQLTGSSGNQTLVWYSLGNFINTQEPAETLFNGLASIDINPMTKKITKASYLPIDQKSVV